MPLSVLKKYHPSRFFSLLANGYLLLLFILLLRGNISAQIYWNGSTDANWNTAANWNGGAVPNAQRAYIDPTVQAYPNAPIISVNSTFSPTRVYVLAGGTLTIQANLTTTDRVRVDGNTSMINMSAGTLNINGTKDLQVQNDGVFNMTGGTINISNTLTVDVGGTFNMSGAGSVINVTKILEVLDKQTLSSSFNMSAGTVTVTSRVELDAAGTVGATPTLNISGGTFTANSHFYWIDNGSPAEYPHLIVSGGTVTIAGNVQRDASTWSKIDIDLSGGSLIINGNLTMNTALDRLDQTGGILQFGNTKNWTNAGTYLATAGTAVFNGSTTLLDATGSWQYYNLTINNAKTLNQSVPPNINVAGDWTNSGGTFIENTNTVTFNGTSLTQTINVSADETYYNLVINKSAGTVNLAAFTDIITTNVLTLTNGVVVTGANICILSNTVAANLVYTNGFIYGTFRRYIASNTSTYYFPVGNGTAATNRHQASFVNNSITGVSYLDASVTNFTQAAPNDDANLSTTEQTTAILYTTGEAAGTTVIWTLSPSASPTGGNYGVQLYVENTTLSAAKDNMFCPLKRNNTASYTNFLTYDATTTIPAAGAAGRIYNAGNGYAQRTGYTSFSEFVIGEGNTQLPIELLSFDAKLDDKVVDITWVTASEINNDYFTVEKSADGKQFEEVAKVNGAGNSTSLLNYNASDLHPLQGISYYRLKQTDYDGKYSYSKMLAVNNKNSLSAVVFPNPASNLFYVNIAGKAEEEVLIVVRDILGKEYCSKKVILSPKQNIIAIDVSQQLAAGIYTIMAKSTGNDTFYESRIVIK